MSRFNSEAYDKLFPRTPDPVPAPETAVEKFTPTKDKLEGKDPDTSEENTPGEQDPIPEDKEVDVDGHAKPSEPDSE